MYIDHNFSHPIEQVSPVDKAAQIPANDQYVKQVQ